jgi:carbamoyltransferase
MAESEYILGVNGWPNRSHDAAACIVRDGQLLVAAEEERFIRKKHAYDKAPINAIAWCLDALSLSVDDIAIVATGWDYKKLYEVNHIHKPSDKEILEAFLPPSHFAYTKLPKLVAVEHHLAHAASTYYLSGMDEAAVVVSDGGGEAEATSFWHGKAGMLKRVDSFPMVDSLGYFYEYVSENLGLGRDGAGKTMGLAAYGKPSYQIDAIRMTPEGYSVTIPVSTKSNRGQLDSQDVVIDSWKTYFNRKQTDVSWTFDQDRVRLSRRIDHSRDNKDFAASAQEALERALINSAFVLTKRLGTKNLCMAGGVALNCSANSKIIQDVGVENLFIPPFPHDGGVSIGAALYASAPKQSSHLDSPYLGPDFSNEQIESVLKESGYVYKKAVNIEREVAQLLADGKVAGWFMGAMEFGPRALGNRSILANPANANMKDRVNDIKLRERWRPFAPSVIEESMGEYFNETYRSPYMLQTYTVKPEVASKIAAVTHYDNTTRAQSVSEQENPRYYRLLQEFKKLTGIPMVLNTSFNGPDEPIVCSPRDAIRTFSTHGLDVLAIGDFIVEKVER